MIRYSIIICTYNRAKLLEETICSLINVLKDRDGYEILIIDNNSPDDTRDVVNKFIKFPKLDYVFEINQGLSFARNRGITEAKGDILIFLDDDIDIDNNYFKVCDRIFQNNELSIVGGKVLPYKTNIPEWLPRKYHYLASVFDLGDNPSHVLKIMGANFIMRKDIAQTIGWYNTDLGRKGDSLMGGEEVDYLDRAHKLGYRTYYCPELIVYHKINNKLNKNYIFNYAFEEGRSQKIADSTSGIKKRIYVRNVKSVAALAIAGVGKLFNLKPATKSYLEIIKAYGIGYLTYKS